MTDYNAEAERVWKDPRQVEGHPSDMTIVDVIADALAAAEKRGMSIMDEEWRRRMVDDHPEWDVRAIEAIAEKRGRVAGLREAHRIVVDLREDDESPRDLRDARDAIAARAEEVERG